MVRPLRDGPRRAVQPRDRRARQIRPKIVASTATVRRAENQIQALFGRRLVDIFPPPGPGPARLVLRRDAHAAAEQRPALRRHRRPGPQPEGRHAARVPRAPGRRAEGVRRAAGGKNDPANPADPYMTLLGYFNSLRELGGARRIVEDEVGNRVDGLRQPQARRRDRRAVREPQDRLRGGRADLARDHRQGGRGEAAAGPAVPREGPRRRGPRHEHDLGRPRHHAARADGRVSASRRPAPSTSRPRAASAATTSGPAWS